MRVIAQTALATALTVCACEQRPALQRGAPSADVEIGLIEAKARQVEDDTVSVDLRWTFTRHTKAIPVAELPPVYLSNGTGMLWAVPSTSPEFDGDEVRFNAKVDVSKDAWNHGCWQASHYIKHVMASGSITCLNQVP